MDHAVALVQAYLQINGYFIVADYPIIESTGKHRINTATTLARFGCCLIEHVDSVTGFLYGAEKSAYEYERC